jgi:hypothetical protein
MEEEIWEIKALTVPAMESRIAALEAENTVLAIILFVCVPCLGIRVWI